LFGRKSAQAGVKPNIGEVFGNAFDGSNTVIGMMDFHPDVHRFVSHGCILAGTIDEANKKAFSTLSEERLDAIQMTATLIHLIHPVSDELIKPQ
jgi:hypothetical protein